MQNKKKSTPLDSKLRSMETESNESREATNGYMERGNPAAIAQKSRVISKNDNGSHL